MVAQVATDKKAGQQFTRNSRRFIGWVTNPHVLISLFLLALMIYLIIIPLYRMVSTTLTYQEKDLVTHPDVVLGQFTFNSLD